MQQMTELTAPELLSRIQQTYPAVFCRNVMQLRPLAIGVHEHLVNLAKSYGCSRKTLYQALALHCTSTPYLFAIKQRRRRVSLEGQETKRPREKHVAWAKALLRARLGTHRWQPAKPPAPAKQAEPAKRPKRPTLTLRRT